MLYINKGIEMKLLFILLVLLSSIVQVRSETIVEFPELSGAKPIVVERQKELYTVLQNVNKNGSNFLKSEAFGRLAQFYYVHEYVDTSIVLYKNAIELAPQNSKWHYLLGIAYKSKGEFDKVIVSFESAWELNDQYLPVMVYLGEVYLQQGLFEKAKTVLQNVLTQNNNYSRALVGLGQVLMQEGEAKAAIEKFKKALKYQPTASQINFLISNAYASLGDMEKSQAYHAKKGTVQAQMYDPIVVALYEESRSYTYYNDKAVQAYRAGDFVNAEIIANKAREYGPDSPYPMVTLANIYVSTDRVQLAVDIMEKAVQENLDVPSFKYILGIIEEINGNNDKSIAWYQSVLKLDPYHKKALLNLSNALMRKGEYDKALNQLQLLQNLDPENPGVLHKKAAIHAHQKKCKLATENIYQAVKNQPKNFAFLLTLVKIAVHCPVEKQVLSDALNAARNIYQFSQKTYVVETLALIEAKNNNYQEAIDYQAQAIFQLLSINNKSNQQKIIRLKENLELYKKNKYPETLFDKTDVDLNPLSFSKIK